MRQAIAKEIDKLAKQLLIADGDFDIANHKKTIVTLFEKLTVLEYLEKDTTQQAIKQAAALDSKSYREENWFKEPEAVPAPEHKDALVEPVMEKIKDLVAQMPKESQKVDDLLEEILPEKKYIKNDLEEFAARYQETPTFERKVQEVKPKEEPILEKREPAKGIEAPSSEQDLVKDKGISDKPKSLNDAISGSLKLGLNDRIAFTKHLFTGSADDLQRVLSQINTFTSYNEANNFIQNQVKPDYNNWVDKEEFEERFMLLLEKRFN
ncbi:hypothetical protein [Patiriisocius marinus]|uniref:Uncharacterized protein n=1 Tax=Patiriisocius marinus TaxID=1397112 RepID=A0A5J4IYF9_9FLAO|nr:hypothetical protein [Patiriisocius marinus]GER58591.1 hypothetical protein ULMA_06990 [Patiriisocius marinus]